MLEVGLGGRLDAVNIVDADIAVITTIDLDHTELLGPDRESIAREKAGIFRSRRAVVCGDPQPPEICGSVPPTLARLGMPSVKTFILNTRPGKPVGDGGVWKVNIRTCRHYL